MFMKRSDTQPWSILSMQTIMTEAIPETLWMVKDLIPTGGLALLVGKPKVGKSTLARHLALSVAQGIPFLGRDTFQCPVGIVSLEEQRWEVCRQIKTFSTDPTLPVYLFCDPPQEGALETLADHIARLGLGLCVVDPVFRLVPVQDINDYAKVQAALDSFRPIAAQTNCAFLLVHHMRKGDSDEFE